MCAARPAPSRAVASTSAAASPRAHRHRPARRPLRPRASPADPYETTQLVSVACTVGALGLAALALGAKREPVPCPSCATAGGERCVFCDATGRRATPIEITQRDRNDDGVLGLTRRNPYECTACKGAGMILCRNCKGSGYVD
jgi:hypothetical protein